MLLRIVLCPPARWGDLDHGGSRRRPRGATKSEGASVVLSFRGGILVSIGNFQEILSQGILLGIILAGRLGVPECRPAREAPGADPRTPARRSRRRAPLWNSSIVYCKIVILAKLWLAISVIYVGLISVYNSNISYISNTYAPLWNSDISRRRASPRLLSGRGASL